MAKNKLSLTIAGVLVGIALLPLSVGAQIIGSSISTMLSNTFPPVGGDNFGMTMQCTCSEGMVAFIKPNNGAPVGLYHFGAFTKYWVQRSQGRAPGSFLGFYLPGAGTCWVGSKPYCIMLKSNRMTWYGEEMPI